MKFSRALVITSFAVLFYLNTFPGRAFSIEPPVAVHVDDTTQTSDTIFITGHYRNGNLKLKDEPGNGATKFPVIYGDDIVWVSTDGSINIVAINEKPKTKNHFKNNRKSLNPKNWRGTVDTYTDYKTHKLKYYFS